jgi:hypothetical protein
MKYHVAVAYRTKREAVECWSVVEAESLSAAVARHMDKMLKGYPARVFVYAKAKPDDGL